LAKEMLAPVLKEETAGKISECAQHASSKYGEQYPDKPFRPTEMLAKN
jgi:hypothetical protein